MIQSPPPDAEGVAYFTIAGADLRMFRCEDQAATLSTKGCAARWSQAQPRARQHGSIDRDAENPCRSCPIGAAHAGEKLVTFARDFGSDRCPRCGFGTTRMIGNRICVSCSNREREVLRGVNGRGNAPKRLPGIVHLPVRYSVDGTWRPAERRTVAVAHRAKVKTGKDRRGKVTYVEHERGGVAEAIFQTLRTTKGRVDFLPLVSAPDVAMQGRLF